MKPRRKVPLAIEVLEDRWVPATIRVLEGNLFITNPILNNGTANVTVQATGTNTFKITNGSSVTVMAAENIIYSGSAVKTNLTLDLNGQTYSGNVIISTGNGNDSVTIGDTTGGGQISGNVTLLTGNGADSVDLNSGAAGAGAFSILGNVQIADARGRDTLTVGNTNGGTAIGGNLSATGYFTAVTLSQGQTDSVGGSLSITNLLTGNASTTIGSGNTSNLTVGGNLTLTNTNSNQTLTLGSGTLTINGNTFVNLGQGSGNFTTAGTVNFNSAFNLNAGDGNDSLTVSAGTTFLGNAAIRLGNGDNSIAGLGSAFTATGNFDIYGGNGNNAVGSATIGSESGGEIAGSLGLFFGNGNNDSITVNAPVGGAVVWQSGNGNSALSLGSPDGNNANNYTINALFGNGNDSFAYHLTPSSLINGYVIGGSGSNYFDPSSTGTPTSTYQQTNF
jgi:hypothetical protein